MTPPNSRNPFDFIGDIQDPSQFAGRRSELALIKEELLRLTGAQPISPVVALVGERRVGKTSLLRRVSELCDEIDLLPCWISVTNSSAADPGVFWLEVLDRLISSASASGIITLDPDTERWSGLPHDIGFRPSASQALNPPATSTPLPLPPLRFLQWYGSRANSPSAPPATLVAQDLASMCRVVQASRFNGVLLILDEAHLLLDATETLQQLRYALREASRCGLICAGERTLNQMFTALTAPFYLQARIIPIQNFATKDDVTECALLPLSDSERPLVNPTTIEHLQRLSHGKPNQIRLICHSIYRRYQKHEQADLNITIEALDDVLDSIQATYAAEYDLKQRVDTIRRLNSIDLESLYLITRYPEWRAEDVVALDEAFRGEGASPRAAERRTRRLAAKRDNFVRMGLLRDEAGKYALLGNEFLQLYLRFWYEVRKFGQLTKRLELGEGPPTPFGEKADKLVRALSWELRRRPDVVMVQSSEPDAQQPPAIARVRKRLSALEHAMTGGVVESREQALLLLECFHLCHLITTRKRYYVLALSVRNLENPRETSVLELYFEGSDPLVIPVQRFARQSEAAHILIEDWDGWAVDIPSLEELVRVATRQTLDQLAEQSGVVAGWYLKSVQEFIKNQDAGKTRQDTKGPAEVTHEAEGWVELYKRSKPQDAVDSLTSLLAENPLRPKAARLYNDRGYIAYAIKERRDAAKRDLDRAVDLHHSALALTLLNLSVLAIDENRFSDAIQYIEDALFITEGQDSIGASFLRLRLLSGHLMFNKRTEWEQNPATALEAAYVNLAYAVAQDTGGDAPQEVLEEGLELMPSSVFLRFALGRLHLSRRQAQLADPIFLELSEIPLSEPGIAAEVRTYRTIGGGKRRRR